MILHCVIHPSETFFETFFECNTRRRAVPHRAPACTGPLCGTARRLVPWLPRRAPAHCRVLRSTLLPESPSTSIRPAPQLASACHDECADADFVFVCSALQMITFMLVASMAQDLPLPLMSPGQSLSELHFGGSALTLVHNASVQDELVCSGKIKAADVLIEGTSTTVAQMIAEFDVIKSRLTAIERSLGMLPPPAMPPPAPPGSPPPPASPPERQISCGLSEGYKGWCGSGSNIVCGSQYPSCDKSTCVARVAEMFPNARRINAGTNANNVQGFCYAMTGSSDSCHSGYPYDKFVSCSVTWS